MKLDCEHVLDLDLTKDVKNLENSQNKLLESSIKGLISSGDVLIKFSGKLVR